MRGAEKLPLVKMYLSLFLAVEQRKESVTSMALLFVLLCEESLGTSGDSLRVGGAVLQAVEVWESGRRSAWALPCPLTAVQHHVTVADKHWCPPRVAAGMVLILQRVKVALQLLLSCGFI